MDVHPHKHSVSAAALCGTVLGCLCACARVCVCACARAWLESFTVITPRGLFSTCSCMSAYRHTHAQTRTHTRTACSVHANRALRWKLQPLKQSADEYKARLCGFQNNSAAQAISLIQTESDTVVFSC